MKNYFDVHGKSAVITGAASGIGKQFALCLAEQGANLALWDLQADKLAEVKAEIEAYGVKCVTSVCSVTDTEQIRAAVDETKSGLGRIDILINNAGVGFNTPAVETTDEEWKRVLSVNVDGMFYVAREVGKVMLEQGYGKIVNTGSFHCMVTMNKVPRVAYSASKGAVLMMTKALASEWAQNGITVNAIGPGYFKSALSDLVTDEEYDRNIRENCPMGRRGVPGELNGAMLFLASDASSYVTGQLVLVDGGWTIV